MSRGISGNSGSPFLYWSEGDNTVTQHEHVYLFLTLASKALAKTTWTSTKQSLTITKYEAEKALGSVKW